MLIMTQYNNVESDDVENDIFVYDIVEYDTY